MPMPRPSRPPPEPRASPELIRFVRENWDIIQWKTAINVEAWRLVRADGGNRCGPEQYARAVQSLRDQGYPPPPGAAD